jgi:hypothetical protein
MKRSSWVLEGDSLGVKYGVETELPVLFSRCGVHSRRGAGDIREGVFLEPMALRDGVFEGVTYGVDDGVKCEDRACRRGGVFGG